MMCRAIMVIVKERHKRMKMEIFYDMDNTLFEMSKPLVNVYSGRVPVYGAIKNITIEQIMRKLHEKGFFAQLEPIYRAQQTIRKLHKKGRKISIISQPMLNNYCISEKNESLEKHYPQISLKNTTYTFNKYLLAKNNRVLIDDHIEHLENWEKNGGIAICFERGYNKNWKGLKIKKHSEIVELIDNLEKGVI